MKTYRCVVVGTELTEDAGRVRDYEHHVVEREERHAANWHGELLTDSQHYALTGKVERRRFPRHTVTI